MCLGGVGPGARWRLAESGSQIEPPPNSGLTVSGLDDQPARDTTTPCPHSSPQLSASGLRGLKAGEQHPDGQLIPGGFRGKGRPARPLTHAQDPGPPACTRAPRKAAAARRPARPAELGLRPLPCPRHCRAALVSTGVTLEAPRARGCWLLQSVKARRDPGPHPPQTLRAGSVGQHCPDPLTPGLGLPQREGAPLGLGGQHCPTPHPGQQQASQREGMPPGLGPGSFC